MSKRFLLAATALCALSLPAQQSHALTGAVEEAPPAAQETLMGQPSTASLAGFYLAGRQALSNRDFDSAAGFYAAALRKDPENVTLLDRALNFNVASGNIAQARQLATTLLEHDPDDQISLLTLAALDLRAGEEESARQHLAKLKAIGGPLQDLIATLLEGWSMAAEGRPAAGVSAIDGFSGPAWAEGFAQTYAGLMADTAELSHIALDRLALAYETGSSDARVVEGYARALARAGRDDRALSVIERFNIQNGATDPVTDRVREEITAGEVAPLIGDPRAGVAEALFGLGRGIGSNDYLLAASLLQLALHLAPQAEHGAMALGSIFESLRQHEAAIEIYRTIAKDSAIHREAMMQEALNLNVLKRHEEAIALLDDLVAEDPTDVAVAIALGNVHRSLENFEEARSVYDAAITTIGDVPAPLWTLYYYRGIANERTKRWPEAERDFRKALELSPEHPLVLNYLGYSYIDRGENLDEALGMVRRAVEQRPKDGYIVDSLGWAYYRLGRYEDAVRELERAVLLRPADPVINDHLGDAYWKVGRRLEAKFQWTHARDNDPEPEELEKILKKLEGGLEALDAADVEETAEAAGAQAEDQTVEPAAETAQ